MSEKPQEQKLVAKTDANECNAPKSYEIKAPHITDGHTFVVTTVVSSTETLTSTSTTTRETLPERKLESPPLLMAVPVPVQKAQISPIMKNDVEAKQFTEIETELPCCSSQAIVPLSSSLPSKLLRFHAKRSAQALLHQTESQSQSIDSQFGSDEGATGTASSSSGSEHMFDVCLTPTAPPMSPPLQVSPTDDKLIDDVGMGSSIGDSEESEEDDELKPLAVDNHMLHDIELNSPTTEQHQQLHLATTTAAAQEQTTAVLSEANLRKHHSHLHQHQSQHQMDNIYLHPNFKYDLHETLEDSPPPAVAPANSPVAETKRVHRSFLTMKKEEKTAAPQKQQEDDVDEVSNVLDTLDAALIPSEELAAEIVDAVEFYFSNESILKDAFLLKHVRRNKEGFVSLKLVSSFKRVRQLTKDWKVVGNAVRRKSHKIELNDLGTKVRRIDPLPSFDETMPSRTIVVCDLPLDKLTIEKVSDIFSKCGEIALIRILKPGMAIPVDVRQFMNKYPEMQQKECALVEYLESNSAREAKHLEGPFHVYEMVAPKKKTGKKAIIQLAAPVARMVENYRYYNDASYERTRGGSFSGVVPHDVDLRFKLKRNNSDFHPKPLGGGDYHQNNHYGSHHHYNHHQHYTQQAQHSPTHRGSFGEHTHPFQHYQPRGSFSHDTQTSNGSPSAGGMSFFAYSPRRYSNTSTISANTAAAVPINEITNAPTATVCSNSGNNSNNNNNNNTSTVSNIQRRLSNCSETNHSAVMGTNDLAGSRRASNCSEHAPQRRDSNCSENCPCSRRVSDFGQNEAYRKSSICSNGSCGGGGVSNNERRHSNGSMQFERTFSNASDGNNGFYRRMSNDFNLDRKSSLEPQTTLPYDPDNLVGGGGGGYNVFPRRYSNNFNLSNKLAAYDNAQYINGRRISTDSGYDRRFSFGSEYEGSPRSRTGSFLSNYKHGNGGAYDYDGQPRSRTGSFLDGSPRSRSGSFAQRAAESLVRTPIGPDGSKGFGTRARKFGQTISPVN